MITKIEIIIQIVVSILVLWFIFSTLLKIYREHNKRKELKKLAKSGLGTMIGYEIRK